MVYPLGWANCSRYTLIGTRGSKAHAAAYLQVECKSVRQRTYGAASTNNHSAARKGTRLHAEPEIAKISSGSAVSNSLRRQESETSPPRFAPALIVCTTALSDVCQRRRLDRRLRL